MLKSFFLVTALAMFGLFLNPAIAEPDKKIEVTEKPEKGNQGCVLLADNSHHSNPGQMMRHVRDISGKNAVQWLADSVEPYEGTVGTWIKRNCQEVD